MDKKAILILEDETTLSKALSIMLEREGFRVKVVSDGLLAAQEIVITTYDLILLDLVTPGMDGFEVLKKVREKDLHVPVFILSNLSEHHHKKKAKEIGADKYFIKSETLLSEVTENVKSSFNG